MIQQTNTTLFNTKDTSKSWWALLHAAIKWSRLQYISVCTFNSNITG